MYYKIASMTNDSTLVWPYQCGRVRGLGGELSLPLPVVAYRSLPVGTCLLQRVICWCVSLFPELEKVAIKRSVNGEKRKICKYLLIQINK